MRSLFDEQATLLRSASRADVLRRELQEMAATIEQARREVAALQPKDTGNNRLMIATNELDAIVSTTERASFDILQSAERLLELIGKARSAGLSADVAGDMENEITNIFTACSFQDLTGQRTNKVVTALRYVEQRVMAMMNLWSGAELGAIAAPPPDATSDRRPDAHLLGGPRDDGVSQDDVDALMKGESPAVKPPSKDDAPAAPVSQAAVQRQDDDSVEPRVPLDQSAIDNLFG
jgi:hypothetical protein